MKPTYSFLVFLAVVSTSLGASLTWDITPGTTGAQDGSGTWDLVNTNWLNGAVNQAFVAGDSVSFGSATGTSAYTVALSSSTNTGNLTLVRTAGYPRYTINVGAGNTLTVNGVVGINGGGSAYYSAFTDGTLQLRGVGTTEAAPDILFGITSRADWGAVIASTTDVGTGTRYIRGAPQRNDLARYSGDLRFNGPLTGSANLLFSGTAVNSSHNMHFVLNAASPGFTGSVTLNANTDLALTKAGALTSANSVTFAPGTARASLFLFGQSITIGNLNESASTGTRYIRNGSRVGTNGLTSTDAGGLTAGSVPLGVDSNSILTVTQTSDGVFGGIISDGGTDNAADAPATGATYRTLGITKAGAAVLTLSGANLYSGPTSVTGGTLVLANSTAVGSSTVSWTGNAVVFDSSVTSHAFTFGGLSGGGNLTMLDNAGAPATVNLTVGGNNLAATFTGPISGAGSITKTGTGLQGLHGTNTYSGGTTLANGALSIISGLGTGPLVITRTTTGGDILTVANDLAVNLPNNVTLAAAASALTYNVIKNAASNVTGTQLDLSGVISGGNANHTLFFNTNKSGDGTTSFRLSGNNTFRSSVTLNRGRFILGHVNGFGDPANLIKIDANNSALGDLTFEMATTLPNPISIGGTSTAPINTNGFNVELSGAISGGAGAASGFTKIGAGTLTLTGANTAAVYTKVTTGTLQVGNGGASGGLGSREITVDSGATLGFNRTTDLTLAGALTNNGTLIKDASNTLSFTAAGVAAGSITINAGTLDAAGGLSGTSALSLTGGTFKFGSVGSVIGNASATSLTQSGGTLALDVGSSGSDILTVADYTRTTGGITVNVASAPTLGTPYTLVTYTGTLTGTPPVTVTGLGGTRLGYTVSYGNGTNSSITITFEGVSGNVFWTGETNSEWDLATTNWNNGSGSDKFFQLDNVLFDDTAPTNRRNVILNFVATPASVSFDHSVDPYTISGSGSIGGATNLAKNGTATLTLATDNTYTGTTTLYGDGVIQVGAGGTTGSVGTGSVLGAGSLIYNRSDSPVVANNISDTVALTQAGSGTLIVTGSISSSPDVTISAGTLQLGNGGATGSISSNIVNNGNFAINRSDATYTFGNPISGTGRVTKLGTTTLVLTGTNSYQGGTYVSGGTLRLDSMARIGTGALNWTAPSTVAHTNTAADSMPQGIVLGAATGAYTILQSAAVAPAASELEISGVISGGSATSVLFFNTDTSGDGSSLLKLSGNNTFTGQVTMNRGVLALTNGSALGAATNLLFLDTNNNATLGSLRLLGSFTLPNPIQLSFRDHTVAVNGSDTVTLTGLVTGNTGFVWDKIGTGKLILANAANSYARPTNVKEGTLDITGTLATSTNAVNVQAAGTLMGNGTINRPVSVTGKLAPGEGVGTLTVGNTVTFAPASTYALQIGDWTGAAGTGYDQVAATNVAITATTGSKMTVSVNTTGMTNFTEASKTFVIATGIQSGLTADNWAVTTTGFSGTGTWALQVNGTQLELVYTSAAGFDSWITGFPGLPLDQRGLTNDYDNDGMSNLLEYVLNGNPAVSDASTVRPSSALTGGNLVFTYSRRDDSKADTTQIVQYGSSLTGWNDVPITALGGGMVEITDGTPSDTVKVTIPMGANTKLFARLKVAK